MRLISTLVCATLINLVANLPASSQSFEVVTSKRIDMDRPKGECARFEEELLHDAATAFCAITGVSGDFRGGGEYGRVVLKTKALPGINGPVIVENWFFEGKSCQRGVSFDITCVRIRN